MQRSIGEKEKNYLWVRTCQLPQRIAMDEEDDSRSNTLAEELQPVWELRCRRVWLKQRRDNTRVFGYNNGVVSDEHHWTFELVHFEDWRMGPSV